MFLNDFGRSSQAKYATEDSRYVIDLARTNYWRKKRRKKITIPQHLNSSLDSDLAMCHFHSPFMSPAIKHARPHCFFFLFRLTGSGALYIHEGSLVVDLCSLTYDGRRDSDICTYL